MARTPTDPDDFTRPIRFAPTNREVERLRYLHAQTGLRGAVLVRYALTVLERVERQTEAREKREVVQVMP